jgi:hypothetical protein
MTENDKQLKEQKKAMRGKQVTPLVKPKINFWRAPEEVNDKSPDAKK